MTRVGFTPDASGIHDMNGKGEILRCEGTGVPTGSTSGYSPGCIYHRIDGSSTTTVLYINTGTSASSTWTALGTGDYT